MQDKKISLLPIGYVNSKRRGTSDDFWGGVISKIELDTSQFTLSSIKGLEQYSHLEVLYYFHQVEADQILKTEGHPRGNSDWPSVGIFAQRKKDRPNQLGVSVCKLIRIEGLVLTVSDLDAIDETPILDIKPYIREFVPNISDVHQPSWVSELMVDYYKKGF